MTNQSMLSSVGMQSPRAVGVSENDSRPDSEMFPIAVVCTQSHACHPVPAQQPGAGMTGGCPPNCTSLLSQGQS